MYYVLIFTYLDFSTGMAQYRIGLLSNQVVLQRLI